MVLRFLAGKYTAGWRDVDAIIKAVEPHISQGDREHILRILTNGCLAKLVWEETAQNKETFIKRGNNPSIKAHWNEVIKVLNKEEQNHHLMVSPRWMCRGSPYAHSTPYTVIVKSGKKACLIWDVSTIVFTGGLQ